MSCSGIQIPCLRHLTWLVCLPRDLCTEAQSEQIRMPRVTEAQLGSGAPQSAHTDTGGRGLVLENIPEIFRVQGSKHGRGISTLGQ